MSEEQDVSKTQTLLIQLVGEVRGLRDTVEEIRIDTKEYPITKNIVETHVKYHEHHFEKITDLEKSNENTKGKWAGIGLAAIGGGGIGGFLTKLFSGGTH